MLKTFIISLFLICGLVFADEFTEESKTKIGGYGELHFNHVNVEKQPATNNLDFHRFVLFFSHQFSSKWSFTSEVELEHNFVHGNLGELELEQAYVSYKFSDALNFDFGVVLPRVGILNETHEPPTFLSTERNSYNTYIIPTTWFGNGMAVRGNIRSMIDYKVTIMEGLKTAGVKSGIRGGRQKGFKADMNTILLNLAVDYTGFEGLVAGLSYSRNQKVGKQDEVFDGINVLELHMRYTNYGAYLTSEFGAIFYEEGDLYKSTGGDLKSSLGGYIELGYDVGQYLFKDIKLYPWISYTYHNTSFSTTSGGDTEKAHRLNEIAFGLTLLPIDAISFKFDYGLRLVGKDNIKIHLINLGVGYMF